MIPLKWLLVLSGALAAFSLVVPSALFLARQFGWLNSVLNVVVACAGVTVVLLIAGLFMHRRRALWLVIPVVAALAFPLYVIVPLAVMMVECQLHHDVESCLP